MHINSNGYTCTHTYSVYVHAPARHGETETLAGDDLENTWRTAVDDKYPEEATRQHSAAIYCKAEQKITQNSV